MELLQLHYFRTVAQTENMTRAAELLRVSQPSLSKTISRLEESLGTQLFVRKGKRIKLNRKGELFLKHINRVFFELEEGRRVVNADDISTSNTVSLTTNISYLISDIYLKFREENPEVYCYQTFESAHGIQKKLESGKTDVAVFDMSSGIDGFDRIELYEDELMAIVPIGYKISGSTLDLHEIAEEQIFTFPRGWSIRDKLDTMFESVGVQPKIVFEDSDAAAFLNMAEKSGGISFTTKFIEYSMFCTGELRGMRSMSHTRLMRLSNPESRWKIGMWRSSNPKNAGLSSLLYAYICDYYSMISKTIDTTANVLLL